MNKVLRTRVQPEMADAIDKHAQNLAEGSGVAQRDLLRRGLQSVGLWPPQEQPQKNTHQK
jgi:hypothetical protein